MTEKSAVRLRFPPSPTGPLHVGNARTLLFNYLFAKQHQGKIVLRIEDTDRERSQEEWAQNIQDELRWLGLAWDEGPYQQSERIETYQKYLAKLIDEKKAYYCFCTSQELEAKRQEQSSRGVAPIYDGTCRNLTEKVVTEKLAANMPSVIRFHVAARKVSFNDLIRGKVEFDMRLVGDFVIAKSLDQPLYHLAVVVDDHEMQISHIIRGEDHIANTPKHILLQQALGFETPYYAHVPILLNPDRSKMSKRAGDVAVADYHQAGYLPEAMVNFMALLGWNPGNEREFFSLEELVKEFSLQKVQKGGAIFNVQKLDSINSHYIKQKPIKKLTALCLPYLSQFDAQQFSQEQLEQIIETAKPRMKKLSDITLLCAFFFAKTLAYPKELLRWREMGDGEVREALERSLAALEKIKKWDEKSIEEMLLKEVEALNKEKGYPEKNRGYLLWPLRVALSGKEHSPGPFEIASILGKATTSSRIQQAIDKFS